MAERKGIESSGPLSGKGVERAKEEHDKSPHHHKETHGTSDDIDENTSIDEVKGPSVLQRAKEEVEALVGSVLPKKK